MKKILLAVAMIVALSVVVAGSALAAVQGAGTLEVSVQVTNVCTVTTTPLSFGSWDAAADKNAIGEIHVLCPDQQAFSVDLDKGMHSDNLSGAIQRYMADAQALNKLKYELYADAPAGTIWGDPDVTTPTYPTGAASVPGVGNGVFQSITVYGTVYAPATVPPAGQYSDLVAVTVNY
jgi:spore coat protein U-like protein